MLTHFHFPSTGLSHFWAFTCMYICTVDSLNNWLICIHSLGLRFLSEDVWSPKAGGALLPVHTLASTRGTIFTLSMRNHVLVTTPFTPQFWRTGNGSCLLLFSVPSTVPGNSRCSKTNVAWIHEIAYLRHLISRKENVCCKFYRVSKSMSFFKTRFFWLKEFTTYSHNFTLKILRQEIKAYLGPS